MSRSHRDAPHHGHGTGATAAPSAGHRSNPRRGPHTCATTPTGRLFDGRCSLSRRPLPRRTSPRPWRTALALAGALALGGCAAPLDTNSDISAPQSIAPFSPLPAGAQYLSPDSQSLTAPEPPDLTTLRPDNLPPAERIPEIVARGRIIVGVSSQLNLIGFYDSTSGELSGFEISLAREIARDIFGDPTKIEFRFLSTSERELALINGTVDIVVRTLSITADRQQHIRFSSPYLHTNTRILTRTYSSIQSADDLANTTICVTKDSIFHKRAADYAPHATFLLTYDWSDCLVALQQHQADAIMADDVILSGIAAQDPYTHLVGKSLGSNDMAVGIAQSSPSRSTDGLVRQVNATLERLRSDRTWNGLYNEWLRPYIGSSGIPPYPLYRQEDDQ